METNLLKTNTTFYKQRVRRYIISKIAGVYNYRLENPKLNNTAKKKLIGLLHNFDVEYNFANNKKRYPNLQERLKQWLLGAPSAINLPMYCVDIIADTARIHKTKTLTDKEQETICNNFHKHIAYQLLKYAEKLKINLTKLY